MKKVRITKSFLQTLSLGDLIDLAKQHDLFVPPKLSRQSLINELVELSIGTEDLSYKTVKTLGVVDCDELQSSYGQTEIHLLLSDPIWCFAFWDFNELEIQQIVDEYGTSHFFLRVMSFETEEDAIPYSCEDIEVNPEMRSLYIHASSQSEFTQVALCYKTREETEVLAKSNFVYFPRKSIRSRLSQAKTEVDEVLNLSGLQYLRLWHYNSFKVLFDDSSED